MDLEKFNGSTTPFITLDACDGHRAENVLNALEAASNGDESQWSQLVKDDTLLRERLIEQGVDEPELRNSIQWDDATILFISSVELSREGRPMPIGDGKLRERIRSWSWSKSRSCRYIWDT